MAKKNTAKAGLKWKKKRWFSILAPQLFEGRVIGEAMAEAAETLVNRMLTVNVTQLTGNIKKQNLAVTLKIVAIENGSARTEVQSFFMQPNSVKYLVRKGTSKIEDSFCCMTKDGKKVRIKPIAVTRTKTNSGINAHLFQSMAAAIIPKAQQLTFNELVTQMVNFDLQKEVKKVLDKIYPLKSFQIRAFGLEKSTRTPLRSDRALKQRVEEDESEDEETLAEDASVTGAAEASETQSEDESSSAASDEETDEMIIEA